MARLVDWILERAEGERIEGVVIGEPVDEEHPGCPRGQVLTWAMAVPWLQDEFDDGFGRPDCPAIYAWTSSWVIFVSRYDGATGPERIPRHPRAMLPTMPGG